MKASIGPPICILSAGRSLCYVPQVIKLPLLVEIRSDSVLYSVLHMNRLQAGRLLKIAFSLVVLGGAGTELFARFFLGLGTPPLTVADPTIEYLFAPNQSVNRFGNNFSTNAFSMRSPPFVQKKHNADEIRVLVFGDSVINGGSLTDQANLATSLALGELSGRNVSVVGNVSAGSWGPPNHLAYIERFGLFDADVVVLVYSSHDYFDVPSFQPLNPSTHPTETPWLAITEGLHRYLPRYLPSPPASRPKSLLEQEQEADADEELHTLYSILRSSVQHVYCVLWPDRDEALGGIHKPGYLQLSNVAEEHGVPVIDIGGRLVGLEEQKIRSLYRDRIHPTNEGQQLLADVLVEIVSGLLDRN